MTHLSPADFAPQSPAMTLEERAACIADLAGPGAARGTLRRNRVYAKALEMLRAVHGDNAADVSRETLFFTSHVRKQIKSLMQGGRRSVRHGGKLCSHCYKPLAGKARYGYCTPCHTLYVKFRRSFDGERFNAEWARDAREKQQQAGQAYGEAGA